MKNLKLESGKICNFTERIRPILIRSGIGIISLLLICLIAAAFIPYSETTEGQIVIGESNEGYIYAKGFLPYSSIAQVRNNMPIDIELKGFNSRRHGYLHGNISYVSPEAVTINKKEYFSLTIVLKDNPFMQKGMKGKVFITLSKKTLLKRILE